MTSYKNILIGADPEVFVRNPNHGGFVSGHGMIKGTKRKPFKVDKGAVQVDGTALEFNIDPAATEDQFVQNVGSVLGQLRTMVTGYDLCYEPVAEFDPEYFKKGIPASAKQLGCDPDFNAWGLCPNDPPDGKRTFRTGAGHIHIGWTQGQDIDDPEFFMECAEVSRHLDYYIGIQSLLWDPDPRRRELYGKAGCFRPKPYGVEYRTLSNRWLESDLLQRWIYRSVVKALSDLEDGYKPEEDYADIAQTIINDNLTDWPKWNFVDIKGHSLPPMLKKAA